MKLPYEIVPVDTAKGERHTPAFRAINPNGKEPVIVDSAGPGGVEARVFDSTAILLYLGEKTGELMGSPADRGELLSWLLFMASGLGPFSGQAVHFQRAAPEKLPYAVNRYRREAERHYAVLDKHLEGREFIVGGGYTIADISAWGWITAGIGGEAEWRDGVRFWKSCGVTHLTLVTYSGRGLRRIEGRKLVDHLAAIERYWNAVGDLL